LRSRDDYKAANQLANEFDIEFTSAFECIGSPVLPVSHRTEFELSLDVNMLISIL